MDMIGLSEGALRLSVFASVFVIMGCAERLCPRRPPVQSRRYRWFTNLSLVVVDSVVLRIVFPILAVGLALYAGSQGWGLLSLVDWPVWLEIILAVILLDMAVWAQHVASHRVPILWRVHKVHHADRDIDVTTGVRFHPVEIVLSMVYKLAIVIVLGPAAFAVVLFEVILNASAMFNHANVRLPLAVDRILRIVIVTPDMHRVHHSIILRETDSNYGFFLSIWDRICGTYLALPRDGHSGMLTGLAEYQDERPSSLIWSLMLPFKSTKTLSKPKVPS